MDLKQQLVIWKRSAYLLEKMSLTSEFCRLLVSKGLFNAEMMKKVHSQTFHVERKLKMLSMLGSHGEDVFTKFLEILAETNHHQVVDDLKKTEKHIKFGEMLPPSFTYFLDLSEFLRKYHHVAVRLGEEEKHILQTFIEGKVEVEARKQLERVQVVGEERDRLKDVIANLNRQIEDLSSQKYSLESSMEKAREEIAVLGTRLHELEALNADCRSEVRRLKHFGQQQDELELYLAEEGQQFGLPGPAEQDIGLVSSIGDVEDNKTSSFRLRLLLYKVNLMVNTLHYIQANLQLLESEEKRLQNLLHKDGLDKETSRDIRKLVNETRNEKKMLRQQVVDGEADIANNENVIKVLRMKVLGVPLTPSRKNYHDNLTHRLGVLLEKLRLDYSEKLNNTNIHHDRGLNKMMQHIQEINHKHMEEVARLKGRIRGKMNEVHRREVLLRRLRHQMNVLTRFHAKNMNASQSIEDCRKIVRQVIGEARKLRAMADLDKDQDKEKARQEDEEANLKPEEERNKKKAAQRTVQINHNTHDKKGKRKRKRKFVGLSDERLMYVADNISEWRALGRKLGVTDNRMDMVEMDTIDPTYDKLGFFTLRTWRDEQNGKVVELFEALKALGRMDLAIIIMPESRVEVIKDYQNDVNENDEQLQEDNFLAAVPVLPQLSVA